MALSKEGMTAYQRNRRAKLATLKADPGMKAVSLEVTKHIEPLAFLKPCQNGCDALHALEVRLAEVERQLSPEEVSRRQALKPGARPNELYGA